MRIACRSRLEWIFATFTLLFANNWLHPTRYDRSGKHGIRTHMAVTPRDLADRPDKPYSATFRTEQVNIKQPTSRDAVIRTLSIGVGRRVRSQADIPVFFKRAETVRLELTSHFRSHLFSRQAPHPAGWFPN